MAAAAAAKRGGEPSCVLRVAFWNLVTRISPLKNIHSTDQEGFGLGVGVGVSVGWS